MQEVLLALGILYFIGGSTYIAMRFIMAGFLPFMMSALRFGIACGPLYAILRLRMPVPKCQEHGWAPRLQACCY